MGHKVHPFGFRVGITAPWRSRWYARKRQFGDWLVQDQLIRKYIGKPKADDLKSLSDAGISRVEIERVGEGDAVTVFLYAARVGLVIGSQGKKIDRLEQELAGLVGCPVKLKVIEIDRPGLDAQIVAKSIADDLERRSPYRRVLRMMADRVRDEGAKGIRIQVKGRLGGAEIARHEHLVRGKVPLQTLRADVDYGEVTAVLSKGTIGVKVWIYKGERMPGKTPETEGSPADGQDRGSRRPPRRPRGA